MIIDVKASLFQHFSFSTYLCAHAVPPGRDPAEMTKEIVEEHIPKVAKAGLGVDNIDVFCEKGVYDAEQSRKMLEAGMVRMTLMLKLTGSIGTRLAREFPRGGAQLHSGKKIKSSDPWSITSASLTLV